MKLMRLTLWLCISCLLPDSGWTQSIYFDDSDSDTIKVGNSYYEVRLLKVNGNIVGIDDKSTAATICSGTESIWKAQFVNTPSIDANDFADSDSRTVQHS